MNLDTLATALLENMPDALVVSDASGVIQHWNQGAERIFGFNKQQALGQSLDIIIPPKLRDRHWCGYNQTVKTGESRYGAGELLAVPALCADGSKISVQFSITPLFEENRMTGMAAIMRDVTAEFAERKRLKQALNDKA